MLEKTAADTTPKLVADPAQTFDMDTWLLDAELPTQSADVFKAGQLPAEAGALRRAIEIERAQLDAEPTAADKSKLVKLETRYAALLQEWVASKITVYVTGISKDALQALRDAHTEQTKDMDNIEEVNRLFGFDLLAAAIIGIAEPGVEYVNEDGTPALYGKVTLRPNQVRAMQNKIGHAQMELILAARNTAQNGVPDVDADFLLEHSGSSKGDTPA